MGAGEVGSHVAFLLLLGTELNKVWLFDTKYKKAQGQAMDINQAMSVMNNEKDCICSSNPEDMKGSDIVVVCSGRRRVPGEIRSDLYGDNVKGVQEICYMINEYCENATILVVTNPSDKLTTLVKYIVKTNVVGIGTELDTARLRELIHHKENIPRREIEAYAYGEHGEGMLFEGIDDAVADEARQIAIETIKRKGSTVFAPALVVVNTIRRMIE